MKPLLKSGWQEIAAPQMFTKSRTFGLSNKENLVTIESYLEYFFKILAHIFSIMWMLIRIKLLMPYIL